MGNNSYIKSIISEFIKFSIPLKKSFLIINENNRHRIFKKNRKIYQYIILLNVVEKENDIQTLIEEAGKHIASDGRLIIIYKNYLQLYFYDIINLVKGKNLSSNNWLSSSDIKSFLLLSGFDLITQKPLCIMNLKIPLFSPILNRLVVNIFPFNHLSFLQAVVARKVGTTIADKSVSIVIPARNEQGNIESLFKKISPVGSETEIIFVEGYSKDNTFAEIERCIKKYSKILPISFKIVKQKGIGKATAVKEGFKLARGEIFIIYDADMSVGFSDLYKFYLALIAHKGEFINGSRLVYPMEKNAMQFLNILGNKFFGFLYSWILGQRIKDTLCGTKVFYKDDYELITRQNFFGKYDPFGDFELLLGAGKLNLKIIDLPIRYFERTYGSTNIKRFKNALELARFSLIAIKQFKMRLI
ncbi:glycosyltransferase family 2 protein [Candidatus Gottesmanbacteria bacterium]|nr:glycosyltransferase family 2 protein [Candidatus Gottesmanbacteria bacterium]